MGVIRVERGELKRGKVGNDSASGSGGAGYWGGDTDSGGDGDC